MFLRSLTFCYRVNLGTISKNFCPRPFSKDGDEKSKYEEKDQRKKGNFPGFARINFSPFRGEQY